MTDTFYYCPFCETSGEGSHECLEQAWSAAMGRHDLEDSRGFWTRGRVVALPERLAKSRRKEALPPPGPLWHSHTSASPPGWPSWRRPAATWKGTTMATEPTIYEHVTPGGETPCGITVEWNTDAEGELVSTVVCGRRAVARMSDGTPICAWCIPDGDGGDIRPLTMMVTIIPDPAEIGRPL